jgi:hypothetical protein
VAAVGFTGALVAMSLDCGASGVCNQYSDCSDGYTCTDGKCVVSASSSDASIDAIADGASTLDSPLLSEASPHDAAAATDATALDATGAADAPDATDAISPADALGE